MEKERYEKAKDYGGGNLNLPSAKQTGVQKRGEIDKENVKKTSKQTPLHTYNNQNPFKRHEVPITTKSVA